jgi:tetratricopeptide (TPR) repeat protein
MKLAHPTVLITLRRLALLVACAATLSHADEYSNVNQLLRAGKLSEAMTKVDVYLESTPRDPQMLFLKGVIQHNSGNKSDAISTFTRLTEDYPELPEPYNNLAVLYAGQNQLDKALAALQMAVRTNPGYAIAHENLGDVYARLAGQSYSRALQLDKSNTNAQSKLTRVGELFSPSTVLQRDATVTPAANSLKTQ